MTIIAEKWLYNYFIIYILGGEDVINSDDETHFTQNPTDCPQYAPGGDEFVKCRVTRDKRGLDVLGEFDLAWSWPNLTFRLSNL